MLYELMQSRRSVRRFKPEMPDRKRIERLLEAAITAPSASNKQPWRFLVVTNPAVIARMAAAVREAVDHIGELTDPTRVTPKDLFGLLTVETLCDLVQTRLTDPRA